MTQDLARYNSDLQQVPAVKAEIESMKQELQRARDAIEYEKKGYPKNYEHGVVMEKKLDAMAREMEKLRAEITNAEKELVLLLLWEIQLQLIMLITAILKLVMQQILIRLSMA